MPQVQDKPKRERIGAVWVKTGQYGKYLSLAIGPKGKSINYVAYPNRNKNGDNDPGYIVYASSPTYKKPAPKREEDLEDGESEQESDDLL